MYQQDQGKKPSALIDFLLVVALIGAMIAIGYAMNALGSILDGTLVNILFVAIVVLACLLVYNRRLSAFRYTLFYEEPEPYEDPAYGGIVTPKLAYPIGTLIVQKGIADKGKVLETVYLDDMEELIRPNGPAAISVGEGVKVKTLKLTRGKSETAHTLVFTRDDVVYRLQFHPDEKLTGLLSALINTRGSEG